MFKTFAISYQPASWTFITSSRTGRFFFKEGGYYGGEWKNGKYHGKGYYHDKDLVQSIGEWSDGVLVKKL